MGASTSAQLIAKGRGENGYNNSGITDSLTWVDYFNDALRDLVDDLNIIEVLPPLAYTPGTREIDLPTDFFSLVELYDGSGCRVTERRTYMQSYPAGYFIMYRGNKYVADFYNYANPATFTGLYIRYPASLSINLTDIPEVPPIGEKALIYYAISKGLANNNETEMSLTYSGKYEQERKKIRTAAARSRSGG